jgi:hypothetical protein
MAVALRDLEQGRQSRPVLRVVPPVPAPPTPPAVFWRRRVLVLLLAVAVTVGAVAVARAVLAPPAAPVAPRLEVAVVVTPGDTLWDLAGRYAPADVDRATWVTQVADRNDVDAGALRPGSSLQVPVAGASVTAAPGGAGTR